MGHPRLRPAPGLSQIPPRSAALTSCCKARRAALSLDSRSEGHCGPRTTTPVGSRTWQTVIV